jgi:hypothetical protein
MAVVIAGRQFWLWRAVDEEAALSVAGQGCRFV